MSKLIKLYNLKRYIIVCSLYLNSVQFSHSVVSDSLRTHGLQHARLPCPSPTPRDYSNHVHRVSDAIQPSHPLLSPSPPAPSPSQHQGLFQWVNSMSAAWRTWAEISFLSRGIFEWFCLFEDPGILNSQLCGFLRKTKVCSSPRTFYIQITFLFSE